MQRIVIKILVNIPREINSPSQNQTSLTELLEAKAYGKSKLSRELEDVVEVIY